MIHTKYKAERTDLWPGLPAMRCVIASVGSLVLHLRSVWQFQDGQRGACCFFTFAVLCWKAGKPKAFSAAINGKWWVLLDRGQLLAP